MPDDHGPTTPEGESTVPDSSPDRDSDRIGPYRILHRLGEGGMGVVFLAEQDRPIRRRVALKLIKLGMDTERVIARFEAERQALALMNHPNVAGVFDAGTTEQGRPYFVMEYVQGDPITDYCDRQRLTVRERLDLFMQVCEGVQHAHHKGIIHRDIKPSNVLVTVVDGTALPKIIDFGVAKAISQRLTERTVYTELGQWVGTPEYMSPEQAELTGLDVDTRTDVYSLGVVLYELLVGAQPFDARSLRKAGLDEIRRKIREDEPPRPSARLGSLGDDSLLAARNRRVELPALERELRGDLDWITLRALAKDRTRRYPSPAELSSDIGRHLSFEPVVARPPSVSYRVGRFARRHRPGVAVAVVLLASLIGLAVTMTVQSTRIARERDRAEREAAKTRAINEFLQDTLGSADPYGRLGREVTVVEALGEAVAKIDRSFAGQPEIEAAVKDTIGRSYLKLGRYEEAEALLTSALELRVGTIGREHLDTAESLHHLGSLRLERGDHQRDDYALAERDLDEALAIRRRLVQPDDPEIADLLSDLARLKHVRSEYDESERLYAESLELRRALLGDEHGIVAETLNDLALTLQARGDVGRAESLFCESLAMARRTGDDRVVAMALNNLATLYRDAGDFAASESYMRESLAMDTEVLGEDHPAVTIRLVNLASVLNLEGEYGDAEGFARTALARYRADHPDGYWETAIALRVLADSLAGSARYDEAEPLYEEAIDIFRESHGADHIRTAVARCGLGIVLLRTQRFPQAERELLFALPHYRERFGDDGVRTQRVLRYLVELYDASGRPQEAAAYRALLTDGV